VCALKTGKPLDRRMPFNAKCAGLFIDRAAQHRTPCGRHVVDLGCGAWPVPCCFLLGKQELSWLLLAGVAVQELESM